MPRPEPIDVIFDGQCAFCLRSLRALRALDVWGRLRFIDGTDRPGVEARFPVLRGTDLDQAMFAVTGDGRAYRGFYAIRYLLRVSPLLWPLLPLFYFPGAGWAGPRVYAWIARNRRSLGCRTSVLPGSDPGPPARGRRKGRSA
jgi:predicted DCC family thiol-disulfide oxidoreductase YuxK